MKWGLKKEKQQTEENKNYKAERNADINNEIAKEEEENWKEKGRKMSGNESEGGRENEEGNERKKAEKEIKE
jgi:hypothetical protein